MFPDEDLDDDDYEDEDDEEFFDEPFDPITSKFKEVVLRGKRFFAISVMKVFLEFIWGEIPKGKYKIPGDMEKQKALVRETRAKQRTATKYVPLCDDVDCNVCRKFVWEKSPQNVNKVRRPKRQSGLGIGQPNF